MTDGSVDKNLRQRASSRVQTREDGSLNVMASIGGVRGLIEASVPSVAFLVTFLMNEDLRLALLVAVGIAGAFALVRLLQRGSLVQSISGVVGVAICAAAANFTGDGRDFYLPGFFINVIYILGFIVSIAVKWPVMGVMFGLVRGESFHWRSDQLRRRQYALATWLIIGVMAARLAVQLPLYLAENVAALGVARLVMGMPLYALALWVGWMLTRPERLAETAIDDQPVNIHREDRVKSEKDEGPEDV